MPSLGIIFWLIALGR